jgi:hypothetical protein
MMSIRVLKHAFTVEILALVILFCNGKLVRSTGDPTKFSDAEIQTLIHTAQKHCGYSDGSDAVGSLGLSHSPKALPVLIELLQNRHPVKFFFQKHWITWEGNFPISDCRVSALLALRQGFISNPIAVAALQEVQSDPDEELAWLAKHLAESDAAIHHPVHPALTGKVVLNPNNSDMWQMLQIQKNGAEYFNRERHQVGDSQALRDLVRYLKEQKDVEDATVSVDSSTVGIHFKSGLDAAIFTTPEGAK